MESSFARISKSCECLELPSLAFPPSLIAYHSGAQELTFLVIDPFAEADEDTGETKQSQNYIHIRIQREYTLSTLSLPTSTAQPGC
jgi:translation initiation factor 1